MDPKSLNALSKKVAKNSLKPMESFMRFISSKLFLHIIFLWFIFQAVFMALSTRFGIPPDETYHYEFIRLFADNGWSPFLSSQEGYYALGEAVRTPFFLYHYLLSLPYHFFDNSTHAVTFLRLFNVALGTGSLYLMYKIANLVRMSDLVRNLSIFMLSSTLMFVFLSASINYDNLFIFLSLASAMLLLLINEKVTATRFLLLLVVLISGLLIKISFLPIAFIVGFLLVLKIARNITGFKEALSKTAAKSRKTNILLGLLILFLVSLFTQRYLVNIARYQTITPNCAKVLALDQCRQSALFRRSEMLENSSRPSPTKSSFEYIGGWSLMMQDRIYGIFGHKIASPTKLTKVYVEILFIVGLIAIIRKFSLRDKRKTVLIAISVFYLSVLLAENYHRYQQYGSFSFAVQGRYLFAILPLLYLIANYYILTMIKRPLLQFGFVLSALFIFVLSSLPSYIYITSPEWHTAKTVEINKELKKTLQNISP